MPFDDHFVPLLTFWYSVDAVFAMAHSLHNLVIEKCCLGLLLQVISLNLKKMLNLFLLSFEKCSLDGIIYWSRFWNGTSLTKISFYWIECWECSGYYGSYIQVHVGHIPVNGGYILVNGGYSPVDRALMVIWKIRAVVNRREVLEMLMHLKITEHHFHWTNVVILVLEVLKWDWSYVSKKKFNHNFLEPL